MASKDVNDLSAPFTADNNCISAASPTVPDNYIEIKNKLLESLNPSEADIYILLLENGTKRIIEIADRADLDRRTALHLVSALQDKGLVRATFKHPIQFTAVPVDKALAILSKTKDRYYARMR